MIAKHGHPDLRNRLKALVTSAREMLEIQQIQKTKEPIFEAYFNEKLTKLQENSGVLFLEVLHRCRPQIPSLDVRIYCSKGQRNKCGEKDEAACHMNSDDC